MFELRLKGVSSSFKGVSRVFERTSKGISVSVSKVFQGSFKGVPRKFLGCFKEDLRVLWSFKWVSRMFKRS